MAFVAFPPASAAKTPYFPDLPSATFDTCHAICLTGARGSTIRLLALADKTEPVLPMPLDVVSYLKMARGQTIPPFLLEIVLKSGHSYFVKNVFDHFDETGMFPLRVWDLRALTDVDSQALLATLNTTKERDAWGDFSKLHPKLDQGNLWLRADDVDHFVEWHDRLWPVTDANQSPPRPIGFRQPEPRSS